MYRTNKIQFQGDTMHPKTSLSLLILVLVLIAGCAAPAARPRTIEHIRLPMGYIPNVQFAPFYVAVNKGYFAAEGIELEFDYSFETDGMKLVGAGQLPFTLASGEQVPLARAQGLPAVYIMQWWQRFPVVVVSLADHNIVQPSDLNGKHIGVPIFGGASYVGWKALVWKAGLDEAAMKVDDIGYTQVAALSQGKVDAAVCYINNEPIQLRRQGYAVNIIPVVDYANLVSNGLVTNEETIAKRPELARGMVRAFLLGLRDTIDKPSEAFTISKKFVDGLGKDAETDAAQQQVLAASIELWKAPRLGVSDPAAWQTTIAVLKQMKLLTSDVPADKLFTNRFVDEVSK
jgi:NitT/TauT family transport system substrate-binding protein